MSRALGLLRKSLASVPLELNDLDWKSDLSPQGDRLASHLSAFANRRGGGFLVFGIADDGTVRGLDRTRARSIVDRLASVGRDGLDPSVRIETAVVPDPLGTDVSILLVHVLESDTKPVHLRGKGIESSYLRTGGQTRKMTREDIGDALVASRTLRFEELPRADVAGTLEEVLDLEIALDRLGASRVSSPTRGIDIAIDYQLAARVHGGVVPTNLGLVLAARDFRRVPGMERLGTRLIVYEGPDRLASAREQEFRTGMLLHVDQVVDRIMDRAPLSEVLRSATRVDLSMWTERSVKEALVNALSHRQYPGPNGPVLVEVFPDRLEFTSPGGLLPAQDVTRLLDRPACTRNELLVDRLRQAHLCEERGRGIDLIVRDAELLGLPPPEMEADESHFRLKISTPRRFKELSRDQRLRAVYLHACLAYVAGNRATNASLRDRFGLPATPTQRVTISRLLREAQEAGVIRIEDPGCADRSARYLPHWA